MSRKKHDEYCCENKYNEDVANALKSKSNKVHYKLYMIYTQDGYTDANGKEVKACNLSQKKFASLMGVKRQQFADYISTAYNAGVPSKRKLFKLSRKINIPYGYLVDNTTEYLREPSKYSGTEDSMRQIGSALTKEVTGEFLSSQRKDQEIVLGMLLKETGLSDIILGKRLTDTAIENLTREIKKTVEKALSIKENLYQPQNPIDIENLDEGE